jgi:hypothetical protein
MKVERKNRDTNATKNFILDSLLKGKSKNSEEVEEEVKGKKRKERKYKKKEKIQPSFRHAPCKSL